MDGILLLQATETLSPPSPDSFLVLFQKVGISILLGILVGLEREHSKSSDDRLFAGIRTFPLIALLGCTTALLSHLHSPWILAVGAAGLFALVTLSYIYNAQVGHFGATSEMSAMLVYILGALVYFEYYELAVAVAVIMVALLSLKSPLHTWVGNIQKEDIYATLKFAIITAVILPALPNETFGPLDVLNPRLIWFFVILIAAISFVGYVASKLVGARRGLTLTGFVGGLVSSTAVTFSFSQKSKEIIGLERTLAAGIVLACTIMFPRVLVYVAIVNPSLLANLWPLLGLLTIAGFGASFVIGWGFQKSSGDAVKLRNPFRLKTALTFGLAFAVILLVAKAAQVYLGDEGVYLAAAVAGLTDVDAITLSMAQLSQTDIAENVAVIAIIIAVLTNTVVKLSIVMALGNSELRRQALKGFGPLVLVASGIVIWMLN